MDLVSEGGEAVAVLREWPGGWEVEITDRPLLVRTLGEGLLVAFCRCFIHGDRLAALTSLGKGTFSADGVRTVAGERDLDALLWFACGTLLELTKAVADVERELRAGGVETTALTGWSVLRDLSSWSQRELLKRVRNKIGFHVDPDMIRAGLTAESPEAEPWLLARGDHPSMADAHTPFGMYPLLLGSGLHRSETSELIKGVFNLQVQIPSALQDAFTDLLGQRGLLIERTRGRRTRG